MSWSSSLDQILQVQLYSLLVSCALVYYCWSANNIALNFQCITILAQELEPLIYLTSTSKQLFWVAWQVKTLLRHFFVPPGHPVWNLRTKTPNNEQVTVPWHQDNAYFDPSALYTLVPTAWIPLIDANVKNGCMQVSRYSHACQTLIGICYDYT